MALYPGMWRFSTNPNHCCIYRVPNHLRALKSEAYTPQLVIIGPLHHSLKSRAFESLGLGDITNAKSMGYLNMEEHKKIYLAKFAQRVEGEKTIDEFRDKIKEAEENIRASYSESTAWIQSPEFVEMVLRDSVFIIEFILRLGEVRPEKIGDPLVDVLLLVHTVYNDLILLENQLPYFILGNLFDPIFPRIRQNTGKQTFGELITTYFQFQGKKVQNSEFIHFTDLLRCVCEETLPKHDYGKCKPIENMHNADKLDSGGVKFKAVGKEFSLYVRFENGCLKMHCLRVDDELEMTLRNIMALEQCHYPSKAHVCNYVFFLEYLIKTDRDVDFLVEKGIIKNCIGQPALVAQMVNKLGLHICDFGSNYYDIADKVNKYYSNPFNKSLAVLKRVYFGNLWTGTATIAATLLLVMTLIQTVSSIIQVMPKAS